MKKEWNSTDRTTFKTDKNKLYRELGKSQVNVGKLPSKKEVETFWTSNGVQRRIIMKKLNGWNGKKNDAKA